jgi:hypothetical protein
VSLTAGANVAVDGGGTPVPFADGLRGSFEISTAPAPAKSLYSRGLLQRLPGERYLHFANDGQAFVTGGVDSPENLLAYADIDNTHDCPGDVSGVLHQYPGHVQDFVEGDPTWAGGKGKALIGAINYLASTGVNVQYLLTLTREHAGSGDDNRIVPWTGCDEQRRFDVSKLDQWEIVFHHMNERGIVVHVVTQETENDQLLNGGQLGLERKLYYRELISRFSHHPGLLWNLGEENTNSSAEVKAYSDYIKALDPYDHPTLLHTFPGQQERRYVPLLGHASFDGVTLQFGDIPESASGGLYGETRKWLEASASAGHRWLVMATEASGADAPVPNSGVSRKQRVYWMWANVMAGGAGFEWYLKRGGGGHAFDHSLEDFREFDELWKQSGHIAKFFNEIVPAAAVRLGELEPANELTSSTSDWVLAKPGFAYIVLLRQGGTTNLDLSDATGTFMVDWFDPRSGVSTASGTVEAGGVVPLGNPPSAGDSDWAIWVHQ